MNKQKRAVIYARVSTARQAQEELPIDSQIDRCRQRADELDAIVDQVFIDEGLSGSTDQRPAFQDAIEYAELAKPDYFITWSTSRFSRSAHDSVLYKRRLDAAGISIVYISQQIDRNQDAGWAMESIFEIFDEMTSRQVSVDTKRSMMRLAEQGYFTGGKPPFGFTPTLATGEKKKRLTAVPDEIEVATQMLHWRLAGLGGKSICDRLNIEGITNRGRRWSQTTVLAVLKSEALVGRTVFNRKDRRTGRRRPESQWIRVQSHDPAVDVELWQSVQDMIKTDTPERGSGSPHSKHLFTGLARCSCGARLQIKTGTGRGGKIYSYYECQTAARGGECSGLRIPAGAFDDWLLDIVAERLFSRETLIEVLKDLQQAAGDWAKDRRTRMQAAQRKLANVESRQNRLFEILELHGRSAPDLGDLTKRLRNNKREIERLEQLIGAIDSEQPPELQIDEQGLDEMRAFLVDKLRDRSDIKRTRALFEDVIDRIEVLADEVHIQYRPDRLIGADVRSTKNWLPGQGFLRTVVEPLPARWRRAA